MLYKVKTLTGCKLKSLDGEIGKVKEFYFDDHHWTVRYLVADTGNWLTGRQVLISPYALGAVNLEDRDITINLTRKQIQDSPPLDSDKPVSRQFEEDYHWYYGWPMYWPGPYMWGPYPYIARDPEQRTEPTEEEKTWDLNLRSTHEVIGYHIQATDGLIGHVEDFVVDDETWAIRYLIIDTKNWWPGREILFSPHWIERISWSESTMFIDLPREIIAAAPEYKDGTPLTRDYEAQLYGHYNRQGYWVDEPKDTVRK